MRASLWVFLCPARNGGLQRTLPPWLPLLLVAPPNPIIISCESLVRVAVASRRLPSSFTLGSSFAVSGVWVSCACSCSCSGSCFSVFSCSCSSYKHNWSSPIKEMCSHSHINMRGFRKYHFLLVSNCKLGYRCSGKICDVRIKQNLSGNKIKILNSGFTFHALKLRRIVEAQLCVKFKEHKSQESLIKLRKGQHHSVVHFSGYLAKHTPHDGSSYKRKNDKG